MNTVHLVVDVDRAVRGTPADTDPVRERHVLADRTVYVGANGAGGVTTRTCTLPEWRAELERLCLGPGDRTASRPAPGEPDLPWELLVATGRALAEQRRDVYDALVARAAPELRTVLYRLHRRTLGRLRVVGTLPTRRRVGWISWVLLPDGWRALTPYLAGTSATPSPMVRLEPRGPQHLVRQVARWTKEAGR